MMWNKIKNLKNVWNYIVGNYRFYIYNTLLSKYLLRKHIREQYEWRLFAMKPDCYNNGACIACGCTTPNLQMASKGCEEDCYPPMMSKTAWQIFKHAHIAVFVKGHYWRIKESSHTLNPEVKRYHLYKNNSFVKNIKIENE